MPRSAASSRQHAQLAVDAVQQLVIGLAERPHALALELGRDGREVDPGGRERFFRRGDVEVERAGELAVVGECAQVCSGIVLITSAPISSAKSPLSSSSREIVSSQIETPAS